MKRTILILLIMLLGVGILLYPTVSNYLANKNGSHVVDSYDESVKKKTEEEIAEEKRLAIEYNQSLTGENIQDPFVPGSGSVLPQNYEALLNMNKDGVMASVLIPKISVKLPIYHGTSDKVLQIGAGHLEGTSLPIGGETTHTVITGHTGLTHAKLFTDLESLKKGDKFYIKVLNETLAYRIDTIEVIEPKDTGKLVPVAGQDYASLITCTPYGVNSHRLVVQGVRTEYVPGEEDGIKAIPGRSLMNNKVLIAALIT
ncbi:MAG: class C sortase, partial [Anaerovoracaceae bacterium]